jgi:hypothetical protein
VASNPVPAQVILERLLLRRATKGDEEAFIALASAHSDETYAIARNLCASDTEAFDLTERAFQLAWNHLHTIPEKCSFRVFVCRFLLKNALQRLRRSASISFLDTLVRPDGGDTGASQVACCCAKIGRLARRPDIVDRLGDAVGSARSRRSRRFRAADRTGNSRRRCGGDSGSARFSGEAANAFRLLARARVPRAALRRAETAREARTWVQ